MNFYRRARFASDAFRNLSSRIVTRAPVQEPPSRILQNGSSNAAKFSGFSSYSCFSKRLGFTVRTTSKNYCNSVNGIIGQRYYHVGRYWLEHLTGLGESRFQHWKASYKDKILPATHPASVRVMLILKEIIEALQRGLSLENVGSVRYASSETDEGRSHDRMED
ncbi:hypothetical protein Ddye_013522 [Dipteronia dyeriana]|uniref:Uncharacterized protein n=1 Tax=Dipteronia dyeriana TaxID=168575 RepID=A0AAE0CJQ4_9ROSI|nr:hypothetical protein Ddye_013522 [Dipteronia dyeriana]